jgi:hypothetical protein
VVGPQPQTLLLLLQRLRQVANLDAVPDERPLELRDRDLLPPYVFEQLSVV